MLADALGCPVVVAGGQEYGAKGAVINAGVALGIYPSYEEGVTRSVTVRRRFEPRQAHTADYQILLQIYRSVRTAMLPVWEQRAQLLSRRAERA
jgi:sugar (pentulose or hexulose) kinase